VNIPVCREGGEQRRVSRDLRQRKGRSEKRKRVKKEQG
jgi:hypothetical protein